MNKCSLCNKKKMVFDCKCLNKYCLQHLQPETHECKNINEFRQIAKDKNTKSLLDNKIVKDKLQKV